MYSSVEEPIMQQPCPDPSGLNPSSPSNTTVCVDSENFHRLYLISVYSIPRKTNTLEGDMSRALVN